MGSKTDYLENKVLDGVLRGTTYTAPSAVYSGLFTTIPSDSTAGTEFTQASSGYTRLITTFCTAGATVTGQSVNVTALIFATMAVSIIAVGWGLLDTVTFGAGNLLYWATVTTVTFATGDQPTVAAGGIVITED